MTFTASDDWDIPTPPAGSGALARETYPRAQALSLANRHWKLGVALAGAVCVGLAAHAVAQGLRPTLPTQNADSDEVTGQGVAPRIEIADSNIAPPPPILWPRSDAATAEPNVAESGAAASARDADASVTAPASAPSDTVSANDDAPAPAVLRGPASATSEAQDSCDSIADRAERMVCASPRLTDADARMRALFRRALADAADRDAVEAGQRRWMAARDQAAAMQGEPGVAQLYSQRIRALSETR